MKLYNTLTRDVADFVPLKDNTARIYSCGPTVYDHAHIGNLSAYVFADTLRRMIGLAAQQQPVHVMNYTDVDDKTIKRSRERYPNLDPKEALRKLTDEYIELFRQDMQRIGNDIDVITFVRATDRIDSMQQLITQLYRGGFAYIADDGVYFSIKAYQDSGKTYGQLLEITASNTSEARIQNDEYDKDNVHDFVLWKKQKDTEPAWDFTLDGQNLAGRPGWHIECSAMSREELGQPFDIHTGGVDLIFPHHENEIAQSTALEVDPTMAQVFAHNEHILVDGKKMAKSANNFYTLSDIIEKGYEPLAFRLLVLQAHYRSQVHFSWENLEAAQNRLKKWQAFADLRWQPKVSRSLEHKTEALLNFEQPRIAITAELANDLNTPEAITWIDRLTDDITTLPRDDKTIEEFTALLRFFDYAFGLQLSKSNDITDSQKQIIHERETVRSEQDWATSDQLRDQLVAQGLGLRDTPHGTIWYRL